jgi:UDP-N-acetylglucosamine acyltransferase
MTARIHATAVVEAGASLGEDVVVGPFCVVGADVVLGKGVRLVSHVAVAGRTRIGDSTIVYPFSSLGHPPQDMKYRGEPSELVIGAHNVVREHVTMNPGTEGGGMLTRVGDHGLFMVGVHVAHDCIVGDHVIFANNATLAGHVTVGDYAIIGGLSAVHQFVRIGCHAMIGGMSAVENDVIPYGLAMGERARLAGLNLVGLERRGFAREDVRALRSAYRLLFATSSDTFADRLEEAGREYQANGLVSEVLDFIRLKSARPLLQTRQENGA